MKSELKTGIFADGENLVIFWKEGKSEMAYTFESPIITGMDIDTPNDFGETVDWVVGGKIWMSKPKPDIRFKVTGFCQADKTVAESSDVGGLIPKLNLFKNVSVSDLFVAINKKLNKRKKK